MNDSGASLLPAVLCLMGPTASGKSAVALQIAHRFPVEIISVDSAQVYRYMDIGTAKPDQLTRDIVPHHLIDLINPDQAYSAACFREDTLRIIAEIQARDRIPLLVGGTMLYFNILYKGIAALPPANDAIRQQIELKAKAKGWPALHAELKRLDVVAADRIQPNDSQRIQRALEICYLAGRSMTEILAEQRMDIFPYRALNIALRPSDRSILHSRIQQRFEDMLKRGLVDEVNFIRKRFQIDMNTPAMRCVGYRQVGMYLNNQINQDEMRDKGIAATRQLAKRQLTWLRSMDDLHYFDCLNKNLSTQVINFLEQQQIFS